MASVLQTNFDAPDKLAAKGTGTTDVIRSLLREQQKDCQVCDLCMQVPVQYWCASLCVCVPTCAFACVHARVHARMCGGRGMSASLPVHKPHTFKHFMCLKGHAGKHARITVWECVHAHAVAIMLAHGKRTHTPVCTTQQAMHATKAPTLHPTPLRACCPRQ